jgi:acetylglutamate kinase
VSGSSAGRTARDTLVLKCGGELLEDAARLEIVVGVAAMAAAAKRPLVIVHGGGKEIDAALESAGIRKEQVDGLRITDDATLEVVVAVLAGTINTRVVAALTTAGVPAVGLTGADAACGRSDPAPPHLAVDGRRIRLGRVGIPSEDADVGLVRLLALEGFVPVVASIGLDRNGQLLNVNADTFASHVAAKLAAWRLVIAGVTPGVLDVNGATVAALGPADIRHLVGSGAATAGMVAKLAACERALAGGAGEVVIVDGRDRAALEAAAVGEPTVMATRVVNRR